MIHSVGQRIPCNGYLGLVGCMLALTCDFTLPGIIHILMVMESSCFLYDNIWLWVYGWHGMLNNVKRFHGVELYTIAFLG